MPDIAILILNWNNQPFLERFLPSLISYTPADLAEIVIADNGSTDQSLQWLTLNYPNIRVIKLDRNYGFAGGYNKAIKQCSHPYILLLNSDVEVTPGWLPPLFQIMKRSTAAAVMPKILSWHDKTSFEYAGASGGFIDHLGYPFCRGRIFDHLEKDSGQYDEAIKVHWTSGACMLVRKDVFEQIGGFDDDFFAHMEEIDLCWRIRRSGEDLWVEPKSVVYHVGGGSLPNESPGKIYLNFRNNLALIYKNLPSGYLTKTLFIRMILDGVAAMKYLIQGKPAYMMSILRAHRDFYRWMGKLRKDRRMNLLPHGERQELLYPNSMVFKYFIKGIRKFSELNYK